MFVLNTVSVIFYTQELTVLSGVVRGCDVKELPLINGVTYTLLDVFEANLHLPSSFRQVVCVQLTLSVIPGLC